MIAEFAGNIAGLANIVPKADKLTFIPMMDIGPVPAPAGAPYTVMFNPEHLEHSERLVVIPRMPQGEFEPEAMYDSSAGETFNIQLMIDGTGASGEKRDVSLEIMRLKMTVGYNGILHMPNYLVIVWGAFLRTAICTDFSVKYTVFKPDGSPLRANEEVDRTGIRVAAAKGSAYDLYLSRELKNAKIVHATTSQAVTDTFIAQKLDVAAGVKQQLQMDAARIPGLRLLPGHFMAINQAMGTPRPRAVAGDYLKAFVEEMKASGFVAASLVRHGIQGAAVAPAAAKP